MIFLRNKRISRRTFLQGTGVSLSLPMLESMSVAGTGARKADNLRLGFYFVPHGAVQSHWRPSTIGALELSPTLKPLEPFRDQLNVISDLALPLAYTEDASAAANHSSSSAVFLSGAHPVKKNEAHVGVTVDQLAARQDQRAGGRWHRQAPQGFIASEKRMLLLAHARPERCAVRHQFAAQAVLRGRHRRRGDGQAQRQHAVVPATGGYG